MLYRFLQGKPHFPAVLPSGGQAQPICEGFQCLAGSVLSACLGDRLFWAKVQNRKLWLACAQEIIEEGIRSFSTTDTVNSAQSPFPGEQPARRVPPSPLPHHPHLV